MKFHVPVVVDEVWPLFDPTDRYKWQEDWEIEIISPPGATTTTAGMIFRRVSEPEREYTVDTFDTKKHIIAYSYGRPDLYDVTVSIELRDNPRGITDVTVTYTATGHNEHMRRMLADDLENQVRDRVTGDNGWATRIGHFVHTGRRLASFEPLAIERTGTIAFDAPPHKVFALMNPAGGNHWTPSTPKYVFGSPEEPGKAMWRAGVGWMLVADYDTEHMILKSVLYLPETEFMIEEVRCAAGPDGATVATVVWRVAGLSREGNEAVQAFFDEHWDNRIAAIKTTYDAMLGERVN